MMEFIKNLFSQEFLPHGHCFFWKTELVSLYIIGDGLTALAYFSIPIAIAYFVCKRKDIAFKWIFILFAIFIMLCGTTHLMFIWTLWNPMYRLEIVIKLLMAVVSIITAIMLWPIIYKALIFPSPTQLKKVNEELTQEINNHKHTGNELKELSLQLESKVDERTKSLADANRKLRDEITERKQAEKSLQYEREYTEHIVSTAPNLICVIAPDGTTVFVNDAVVNVTGYTNEEILGKNWWKVLYQGEEYKRVERLLHNLQNEKIVDYEMILTTKNKEKRSISWNATNRYDKHHRLLEIIGIGTDITERNQNKLELEEHRKHLELMVDERTREIEEKSGRLEKSERALIYLLEDVNVTRENLINANIELKKLDQLKSMFIASMSHELRTPLNSIIGFTGIILQGMDGEINPKQNDHLGRVNRSAKHLLSLINDIIDLSKVEAGKVDVFPEDIVLDEVVNETVDSVRLQANEKGLNLDVSVPLGIRVNTDRRRLYQCILNYLSNAVKFTESGTIGVTALETNEEVEIVVSDTGIGISKENQEGLFKPFSRIDSHLRTVTLGTGLGLYLTSKIATELLGGTVGVESQHRKGSAFMLRLPKRIKKD